ncbi:MAG: hypothetical protein KC646_08955 [Candidatus Cloacimonetes bacterium]|nr:hypothetical protein [Candidatus Cloacimonadota bacterium]
MLYPIILRSIQFLSETPCSQNKRDKEIKIYSEFPKNLFVSILLLIFLIVLVSLFIQLSIMVYSAISIGELPFTQESLPYLLAYCLVNLLFLAHLCLYFGYKEEIVFSDDSVFIQHGYFSFFERTILNKDQLMFSSVKENFIGNQHIKLYYCSSAKALNKSHLKEADIDTIIVGTYLVEDQIETISQMIKRLSF